MVASGLTLIYGVLGVLNFAHGSLFAVGALVATSVIGTVFPSIPVFIGAALVGAVVVGVLGLVVERTVVRRLYRGDHITMLLATFAILLIVEGASELLWGDSPATVNQPKVLSGNVHVLGAALPAYSILLVVIGAVFAVGLFLLLNRSRFGRDIKAIAQDQVMGEAVGLNTKRVMFLVFGLGSALAGLAGVLIAPTVSVSANLGDSYILESFAVVIIGGLGSITGSLISSILVGVTEALAVAYFPFLSGFTFYILVAVVLLVRPRGLLGNARIGAAA
ncbi:branched-chain amino acid ABC transporter permease [Frondihabitans sucicola]|uniref:branched-chain amino acid ABC transporter permease n=1 Tax=Frondihabitans sucicola TaxID=1268041 RepID=UPI0025737022|nr:branched-chain amino acid ABC transporter permease [Frondihabitans sucicola]